MTEPRHPIQIVASRTGLSAHVIRVWEKRYGAVRPERTASGRRMYSDEEIRRLNLLRQLAESGRGIGSIARRPTNELLALVESGPGSLAPYAKVAADVSVDRRLEQALAAVRGLDARVLDGVLQQAELELGRQGVLLRLLAPLARAIGEEWREGRITAAHEHFATAVIRVFLGQAAKPFGATADAPTLIVATPAGQLHELGALLAASAATNLGWHVVYLGASLPSVEIAGAARQHRARAVALSLVYPEDDAALPAELARLCQLLGPTPLLVGGRAMPAYRATLELSGAACVDDLTSLGHRLDALRRSRPGGPEPTR